jgi:hypothetical protein
VTKNLLDYRFLFALDEADNLHRPP